MIEKIGILGAGTMGHSIALSFAQNGFEVNLYDISDVALDQAKQKIKMELDLMASEGLVAQDKIEPALSRICCFTDLEEAVKDRDYILEASPEKIEIKRALLRQLDAYCMHDAVIASNTSSLALTDMIADMHDCRKRRTMICHWFNPAHLVPMVELSYYGNMDEEVFQTVYDLYIRIGKKPVKILKESPGLIANRIQASIIREVFSLMEKGIASYDDIDQALMYGPAFRLATTGPIRIADFGGLDIWCALGDNLLPDMDNSTQSSEIIRDKVVEHKLGLKTGEGFYNYPPDVKEKLETAFQKRLIHQLKVYDHIK